MMGTKAKEGDPKDKEKFRRVMPKWSSDNLLRVCMQFYNKTEGPTKREQFRYVLEYTAFGGFVNYVPQASNTTANPADIKDPRSWCARPHDYDKIYAPPISAKEWLAMNHDDYDPDCEQRDTYDPACDFAEPEEEEEKEEGGGRRLQVGLNDEEALEQELQFEAEEAARRAGAAPLPPPYHGINTTSMTLDSGLMVSNVTWVRPLNISRDGLMNMEINGTYMVLLNWGVWNYTNSTDQEYIWGAKSTDDALEWTFYAATRASLISAGIGLGAL